ncbi:HlyD family secretion protein [Aquisphaera giovannonii]|uniref:HlyD family secretion protein n=1 Tax=Aquisphaera giovannonii TaxID=406548 RepID=A0A5B9W702_9BACT|nr:hypothetical protein [Aquisphaera giovannonii]QEH35909.1 HlyD family secretion protein [Aquisphaera giovannonii]
MKAMARGILVVRTFWLTAALVVAGGVAESVAQEPLPGRLGEITDSPPLLKLERKPEAPGPQAAAPKPESQAAPKADATKPKADAPATVKVEKGTFRVDVSVPAVFEPVKAVEVSISPKAWAQPMMVERAAGLGTAVKRGDILVDIDREKIDKAIQDAEVDLAAGELALKHAAEELPILEKLLPLDLAAAERTKAQADEDLARFLEIDRPQAEKMAAFSLKSATESLEYSREELRQLEKMYRSKDLTEETEEIILRRTRFQVESAEVYLKSAQLQSEATLKIQLPRQEIAAREAAARQALEIQRARTGLPLTLNQKRQALAKLQHDHARAAEKLADLRRDRDAMSVHAPADGLVYYGREERGAWPQAAALASKLRKGGTLAADEVFITIVAPRPLVAVASVEEKELRHLAGRADLKGLAVPTIDPALASPAHLVSLTPVPREAGKFDIVADVELGPEAALIKPGMACTLKFTTYRARDALSLPSSSVFEEEADDGSPVQVVYRPGPDGKPSRQVVKAGKVHGGRTEILSGLRQGDEVLAAKP